MTCALARAPAAALTHLVARSCSRPLVDPGQDLDRTGFILAGERRMLGGALALVVGRKPARREAPA